MNIKGLDVYSMMSTDIYRGISKAFFPKWEGWKLLEAGADSYLVDKAVDSFYLTYFYYYLKVDMVGDRLIEFCIMNFATSHGKRKAIMKLEKAAGFPITGKPSASLMEFLSDNKNEVVPVLLLELLEFYEFIGDIRGGLWVLNIYREFKIGR